jgi:hypothetical protein
MKAMRLNKCWGDELTLRALCDAFGVNIHVITTAKENWHLRYEPTVEANHRRHLFLAYISPIHYNSLTIAKAE